MYKGTYNAEGDTGAKTYKEFKSWLNNVKEEDFLFDKGGKVKKNPLI